jgi:hypothetical protein
VAAWLRERGHRLTPPKQPSSSQTEDDPDKYVDNVTGLICEELDTTEMLP